MSAVTGPGPNVPRRGSYRGVFAVAGEGRFDRAADAWHGGKAQSVIAAVGMRGAVAGGSVADAGRNEFAGARCADLSQIVLLAGRGVLTRECIENCDLAALCAPHLR